MGREHGGGDGVVGKSVGGMGVYGESQNHEAVRGVGHIGAGVSGTSDWVGVYGESTNNNGVLGLSHHPFNAAVSAVNDAGYGLWAEAKGGRGIAARFVGDVEVTGDIKLQNADCAEDFDIGADISVEAGTVMALGEDGSLYPSEVAFDKRVAGVVSGAGDYKPGIVLDKQESGGNRQPVALLGKVFCKVDAQYGAIAVGDLLTTSSTPGHAMKADDPLKAFGSVIGKALRPLAAGQGLIPILIAMQ